MYRIASLVLVLLLSAPGVSFASCNALPYTLANGNSADAGQVMANFNYLLNCLNSANPPGGPAGGDLSGTYPNPHVSLSAPLPASQGGTGANNGANIYTFPNRSDTVAVLGAADQLLSGGANLTAYSIGTISSGTVTPDCGKNPAQYLTNNGAFTLAAPSSDGACILLITNGSSAGAITFSGFTVSLNTGDLLTTASGSKFMLSILRINGTSTYVTKALQ